MNADKKSASNQRHRRYKKDQRKSVLNQRHQRKNNRKQIKKLVLNQSRSGRLARRRLSVDIKQPFLYPIKWRVRDLNAIP